jgi:hypothetical protein
MRLSGEYRGEAKAIGIDDSLRNHDAGGVSKWRRRSLGQTSGTGLCQGKSGSGAFLGAAIAKSDRTFQRPCGGMVFRGDCCVLSKSDFCDEQGRLAVGDR